MSRCGTAETHCCWIKGEVCPHLSSGQNGFVWACGLRAKCASWEEVHALSEYDSVRQKLRGANIQQDCGDWPPPGVRCGDCGDVG